MGSEGMPAMKINDYRAACSLVCYSGQVKFKVQHYACLLLLAKVHLVMSLTTYNKLF